MSVALPAALSPRTAEQIRTEWLEQLFPPGWVWARRPDSNLASLIWPFAVSIAAVEADIAAMANEINPSNSTLLLEDYEAVLGNDPCGKDPALMSLAERQAFDNDRWIGNAGVSWAFFEDLAAKSGVSISIEEPEPPVCGVARCGAARCGTWKLRFVWVVTLPDRNTGLECPFMRNNPPDLTLIFKYADGS